MNVGQSKSVGVALILTFFFGALGLFYSSVAGGIIMLFVEAILFILGFVTFGAAWLLFGAAWVVSIIWGCVAASGSVNTQVVHTNGRY